MTLVEKINAGIKEAMRSRDKVRLSTLRMLKSKIMTVDARSNLPDEEVLKIFKTYFGNLKETLRQASEANRTDIVEEVEQELAIIQEFLPKALSLEETKRIVEEAIKKSGAKTKRDLGLVMKAVMQINKAVDGKMAKALASELLAD